MGFPRELRLSGTYKQWGLRHIDAARDYLSIVEENTY